MDRCRVWESHSDSSGRRISKPEPAYPAYVVKKSEKNPDPVRTVTVNKPERSVDDSNELLRKLVEMLTPVATATARAPEPPVLDKLVQLLMEKVATRNRSLRRRPNRQSWKRGYKPFSKENSYRTSSSDPDRYDVTGRK